MREENVPKKTPPNELPGCHVPLDTCTEELSKDAQGRVENVPEEGGPKRCFGTGLLCEVPPPPFHTHGQS